MKPQAFATLAIVALLAGCNNTNTVFLIDDFSLTPSTPLATLHNQNLHLEKVQPDGTVLLTQTPGNGSLECKPHQPLTLPGNTTPELLTSDPQTQTATFRTTTQTLSHPVAP